MADEKEPRKETRRRGRRGGAAARSSPASQPAAAAANGTSTCSSRPASAAASKGKARRFERVTAPGERAHMTPQEKARRRAEGVCLYCGSDAHLVKQCPRRSRASSSRKETAAACEEGKSEASKSETSVKAHGESSSPTAAAPSQAPAPALAAPFPAPEPVSKPACNSASSSTTGSFVSASAVPTDKTATTSKQQQPETAAQKPTLNFAIPLEAPTSAPKTTTAPKPASTSTAPTTSKVAPADTTTESADPKASSSGTSKGTSSSNGGGGGGGLFANIKNFTFGSFGSSSASKCSPAASASSFTASASSSAPTPKPKAQLQPQTETQAAASSSSSTAKPSSSSSSTGAQSSSRSSSKLSLDVLSSTWNGVPASGSSASSSSAQASSSASKGLPSAAQFIGSGQPRASTSGTTTTTTTSTSPLADFKFDPSFGQPSAFKFSAPMSPPMARSTSSNKGKAPMFAAPRSYTVRPATVKLAPMARPPPSLASLPLNVKRLIVSHVRDDSDAGKYVQKDPWNKTRALADVRTVALVGDPGLYQAAKEAVFHTLDLKHRTNDEIRWFVHRVLPSVAPLVRHVRVRTQHVGADDEPDFYGAAPEPRRPRITLTQAEAEHEFGDAAKAHSVAAGEATLKALKKKIRSERLQDTVNMGRRLGFSETALRERPPTFQLMSDESITSEAREMVAVGMRHNMHLEVLDKLLRVEVVDTDAHIAALDQLTPNPREAGTKREVADAILSRAHQLTGLHIRGTDCDVDSSAFESVLCKAKNLRSLTLKNAIGECGCMPDGVMLSIGDLQHLEELRLTRGNFACDCWLDVVPHPTAPVKKLILGDHAHVSYDKLREMLERYKDTLEELELTRCPIERIGGATGEADDMPHWRGSSLADAPRRIREAAKPFAPMARLRKVTVAASVPAWFMHLFDDQPAIRELRLGACPSWHPDEIVAHVKRHATRALRRVVFTKSAILCLHGRENDSAAQSADEGMVRLGVEPLGVRVTKERKWATEEEDEDFEQEERVVRQLEMERAAKLAAETFCSSVLGQP